MKKNSIKLIISIISIILIVSVLCGKIVKADTAPNFENIDALKAAGRNGKVKIGDTVKFEENVSSGRTDYFCYEHGEGEFKYGNYTINDIIEINGSKAKSYKNNSTVVASTENALMSYIFSGGNYSKSHLISVDNQLYVTGRNIAIWAYQNIWQNKLGGTNFFSRQWGDYDSVDINNETNFKNKFSGQISEEVDKAWNLVKDAKTYAKSKPTPSVKITGNQNISAPKDNYYGPFKVSYSGQQCKIKVINTSDEDVTEKIELYDKDQKLIQAKKIPNDEDFYIKGNGIGTIKRVRVTVSSPDVFNIKMYILKTGSLNSSGLTGQAIVIIDDLGSTNQTKYVEFNRVGNLTINKKDDYSGAGLKGASYRLYAVNRGWLQDKLDSNGNKTGLYAYTEYQNLATIYETGESNTITLNNLPYDTYYLSEVKAPNGYVLSEQDGYKTESVKRGEGKVIDGKYEEIDTGEYIDINRVVVLDGNYEFNTSGVIENEGGSFQFSKSQTEITVYNTKRGKLTIKKIDADSKAGLKGAGYKIYKSSGNKKGWVKKSGNKYEFMDFPDQATEFKSGDSDTITIENLPYGKYYLSEVTAPIGYELSEQEGYSTELQVGNNPIEFKRVALGSFDINKQDSTIEVQNKGKISIKGYVWIDQKLNKDDTYNSLYDESNNEKKVAGVTVNLVYKTSNQAVATTTTNENGEYVFEKVLSSGQLKDYYVEFKYNGVKVNIDNVSEDISKYIPVAFNSTNANEITANGSRAMMNSVAEKDEDLNGIATTYTGTDAAKETTYGLGANGNLYSKLISEDGSILDNINLGIKKIPNADYSISQDIAYLKMIMNGNSYIYYYGNNGNSEQVLAPRISWQKKGTISGYTAPIYPSYIAQEKILNDNSKPENLKIYVVYRTDITNTTTLGTGNAAENMKELYQEKSLVIGSLKNVYDTNRYTLETEYDLNDDNTVKKDFNDWKLEEENKEGTAVYNYNKVIEPGKTESTYIEFKVKRNAIIDILNHPNGIIEKYPTNAIASNTYHNYTRTDYSWTNDISKENQQHRKNDIDMNAEAPYLIFKLGEERILSGKVFKDNVDEAYKKEGQVLGNGKYDEDENVVENVTVDLIDKDGNYATLYKAKSDGTAEAVKAETKTDEKGKYSLNGIVPGEYVLRFTYGDGTQKIRTVGGNEINTVQAIDYKSTIVKNEVAKNALEGKAGIEWYKDLNADINSVATDNLETRARVNEGTGNTIVAQTAKVGITMENSKKQYEIIGLNDDGNQTTFTAKDSNGNEKELRLLNSIIEGKNTFNGLSFGIIEQPKQSAEIEKLITNVKLTNAQNNVIFNGNPETNTMAGVTDLDGKENQGSSYVRVELPEESIYGSNMEVTYQVKVTNTSDLNYYNNEYYWFGDVDSDKEVLFQPTEVKDYLDNSLTYVEDKSDKDKINSIGLKDIKIYGNNVKANAFELKGWTPLYTIKNKNRTEGTSDKVTIVAQRILSNQDNDMEIISKAEITKGENTNSRGEVNDELKNVRPATDVHSESNTKLTITPPTGENRNILTIYIISSIISLVVLSIGIVIIKKKIK